MSPLRADRVGQDKKKSSIVFRLKMRTTQQISSIHMHNDYEQVMMQVYGNVGATSNITKYLVTDELASRVTMGREERKSQLLMNIVIIMIYL